MVSFSFDFSVSVNGGSYQIGVRETEGGEVAERCFRESTTFNAHTCSGYVDPHTYSGPLLRASSKRQSPTTYMIATQD